MIKILIGCEKFVIFHCFICIGIDTMLLQLAYIYIYIYIYIPAELKGLNSSCLTKAISEMTYCQFFFNQTEF